MKISLLVGMITLKKVGFLLVMDGEILYNARLLFTPVRDLVLGLDAPPEIRAYFSDQ